MRRRNPFSKPDLKEVVILPAKNKKMRGSGRRSLLALASLVSQGFRHNRQVDS